jgi:hypothetical protein
MSDGQMMVPKNISQDELIAILTDMLESVRSGDSFEGYIEYAMPDPGQDPHSFNVLANYRVGNSMGQGGVKLLGEWAMVRVPQHVQPGDE